ncbi:CBS domain containing-hemolysin-like protein [Jatrophihabitans sp. GAS493]|uniref:hemolysin family protein n=1 Tax=Jatrophihabitans sp. GAS493 TaxID=1907575 RepID=UPI000BB67C49|nr:hemolysin family protein [Jatrophihabitans sp. GAS493]SOD71432.1 CBS domain containing-hemolysin-like protein [Jatrophihabitans sp. GAS493]
MSSGWGLLLAVLLLVANGLFVAAEFALVSVRRSAIEPLAAKGSRSARTTLRAMEQVSVMMAGAQLGITVCSLGLGAIAEPALAHLLEAPLHALGLPDDLQHPLAFAAALLIVVGLHVVLGEMVPKNLALAGPERTATALAPGLVALVRVLRPVVAGLNAAANATLRLFGVAPQAEVASAFTRDQVADLIEESHREGLLDDDEHELLAGALGIDTLPVLSVLMPLDGLVTLPVGSTPREIEAVAASTGFSRFPVRDASGDLTGYLHLKDVLSTEAATRDAPVAATQLRPLIRIGADEPLRSALSRMKISGAHLAQVSQADGTVVGVVALDDVLEELVGEIRSGSPDAGLSD